ncbi:MAG: hypothetical protein ACFCU1_08790 [Sumerlaeia bacterium]
MVFRQSSKQLFALAGFFLLSSASAFSQGAALEDAEQQRIIEAMAAEIRILVTQNNFTAAVEKANELQSIDPKNPAAIVWKNFSERQLSGPQESRLEKLLGVSINKSDFIPVAADDEAPINSQVAALPPSQSRPDQPAATPAQNTTTDTPITPVDDPFANQPTIDDPFANPDSVEDPFSTNANAQNAENPFNNTPAENPFDAPPPANTDSADAGNTQIAAVPPTIPGDSAPPAPRPVPVVQPAETSEGGSSMMLYIIIGASGLVLLGLIFFILNRKKSGDEKTPAKSTTKTPVAKTAKTSAGVMHDSVTQTPNEEKDDMPLSAPSFGAADPITRFSQDKQTNSDMPTRDGKTSSDLPTKDHVTRDGITSQDPPSFAEGDDALYQSLADDESPSETLELESPNLNDSVVEEEEGDSMTLGEITLDSDGETKAPQAQKEPEIDAEKTGDLTFGSIMFADSDETKGVPEAKKEEPKQAEEDDYNDMSFNSMMFGGAEETKAPSSKPKTESKQTIPPAISGKRGQPKAALPPQPNEDDELEEGEKTFSSLMFDGEETVAPPGMGAERMTAEQKTGERGYDDIMFDQSEETLAPGLENLDNKDTQPLPGLGETRILDENKDSVRDPDLEETKPLNEKRTKREDNADDDDDVIKL